MLRRLSAILVLTTVIATLLPTSSGSAQIIPNPVATPKPGGATAAAPAAQPGDPGAPSSVPPAASPEYGVVPHLMGYPESTQRDVDLIKGANLQWVKLTVPWRSIEASCKGCIDWDELDRVMLASSAAGLKVLARVDHPPAWARAIPAENGPPDDPYDYADFVGEMSRRYANGSPKGTIHAIQVWNEPNLSREWGGTGVEPIIIAPLGRRVHVAAAAVVPGDQGEGSDQDRRQRRPLADGHERRHGHRTTSPTWSGCTTTTWTSTRTRSAPTHRATARRPTPSASRTRPSRTTRSTSAGSSRSAR